MCFSRMDGWVVRIRMCFIVLYVLFDADRAYNRWKLPDSKRLVYSIEKSEYSANSQ